MEQSINHLLVQGPFCGKNLFFRGTTGLLSITLSLTGMWFAKSYNCLHCRNWKISWVSINRGIGWVPPPPPWWFTYATYGPWSEGDLKSSVTHLYVEHVLVETNSLDMQIFQSMPPPHPTWNVHLQEVPVWVVWKDYRDRKGGGGESCFHQYKMSKVTRTSMSSGSLAADLWVARWM